LALTDSLSGASAQDIDAWKEQTQQDIDENIVELQDEVVPDARIDADVDALSGPVDKEEIRRLAKAGDVTALESRLKGVAGADAVLNDAKVRQALNQIRDAAREGRLGPAERDALATALVSGGFVTAANVGNITRLYGNAESDSRLMQRLNTAVADSGTLPSGGDATLVIVGGVDSGDVISLGNGTLLVGSGDETQGMAVVAGHTAEAFGMSFSAGQPYPESRSQPVTSGTVLINRGTSPISYTVNGQSFRMERNYSQHLSAGTTWTVEFDRGDGQGTAKYQLQEGSYKFTRGANGWELYHQQPFTLTIDNAGNRNPFHYEVNNVPQVVAAGRTNTHSDRYPLIVRFDNGQGQTEQKKFCGGTCRVAIGPDNTLDLFEPGEVVSPTPVRELPARQKINLFGRSSERTANPRPNPTDPRAAVAPLMGW
jgi:hypothetical protein